MPTHPPPAYREYLTATEFVEIGRRIEALERPAAAAREQAGKRVEPCGKFPQGETGKTRDKVGAALGVSGRTYEKAKQVVDAAEADPERFADLPARSYPPSWVLPKPGSKVDHTGNSWGQRHCLFAPPYR